MRELRINVDSLLSSTLTPDQFIILLLLHKKEFKAVERLVLRLFGYPDQWIGEIYQILEEDGWIKINGDKLPQDIVVRQKFLELLNESTNMDISSWIDEYRTLFKGKKPGCVGDRQMCIKHMTWLLTEYPEYSKEDVMKAASYYISTCAKDNYQYLMQAHYFLSKEDRTGTPVHAVLSYLEETKDKEFSEPKDFTKAI